MTSRLRLMFCTSISSSKPLMGEWRRRAEMQNTSYTASVLDHGMYPDLFPKGKSRHDEAQDIERLVNEAVQKYAYIIVSPSYSLSSHTHSSDRLPRPTYVLPTRIYTRAQHQTTNSFSDVWRLPPSTFQPRSLRRRRFS